MNKAMTMLAEDLGFSFVLSPVKYRGMGGPTEFWDYGLESFEVMAALAEATDRIRLYGSVALPTVHPAITARRAATIDHISQGRFGINLVSGWQKAEYEQMGLWPGDVHYERRYQYAREYVDILKLLWTRRDVDYDETCATAGTTASDELRSFAPGNRHAVHGATHHGPRRRHGDACLRPTAAIDGRDRRRPLRSSSRRPKPTPGPFRLVRTRGARHDDGQAVIGRARRRKTSPGITRIIACTRSAAILDRIGTVPGTEDRAYLSVPALRSWRAVLPLMRRAKLAPAAAGTGRRSCHLSSIAPMQRCHLTLADPAVSQAPRHAIPEVE
jgi:hypothetical protein